MNEKFQAEDQMKEKLQAEDQMNEKFQAEDQMNEKFQAEDQCCLTVFNYQAIYVSLFRSIPITLFLSLTLNQVR